MTGVQTCALPISTLAHSMEDLFYFLREEKPSNVDCSTLSDLLLEGVDFIKLEVEKLKNGDNADGDAAALIDRINKFLSVLRQGNNSTVSTKEIKVGQIDTKKQQYYISQSKVEASTYNNAYKAIIYFEDGCGMENIRAYSVIHNLKDFTDQIFYLPDDIIDNDECIEAIRNGGFKVYLKTDCSYEEMHKIFMQTIFLKNLELIQLENDDELKQFLEEKEFTDQEYFNKAPCQHAKYKQAKE